MNVREGMTFRAGQHVLSPKAQPIQGMPKLNGHPKYQSQSLKPSSLTPTDPLKLSSKPSSPLRG